MKILFLSPILKKKYPQDVKKFCVIGLSIFEVSFGIIFDFEWEE